MPNHRTTRIAPFPAVLILAAALAGCDVEWEGAELALERPPTPEDTATVPESAVRELPDLPSGPLLYRVESDPAGESRVTPVAALRGGGLDTLAIPPEAPEVWWRRFDSTFLAAGRELEVHAGSNRAGTVVLTGVAEPSGPRCPGAASGRLLLTPGRAAPPVAFAVQGREGRGPPPGPGPGEPTTRQETFGPILAERLLQEAGVERHYLARNVDLHPVLLEDTVPGMAATYLISDTLAPGSPTGPGESVSLFFLARLEDAGYSAEWSRVARYDDAGGKEAYRHVESLRLEGGRLDVLRRYDGSGTRLVAAWVPGGEGERRILWSETAACAPAPRSGGEAP